jgi:hypothetical protein
MTAEAKIIQLPKANRSVAVQPGRWVRGGLLEPMWGLSEEAARKYRSNGTWLEGRHWKKDPVGRVVYNPKAINEWFETGQ